jgi:uncharacterized coiled-coil DUF342 family protein
MADEQGAPEGQSAPQIPSGTTEPFFSYKFADGKEEIYKTKDELAKAYRDSYLRQSDYTKKTQETASVKKQIEEERKKFQEEQKMFLESRKKYDQWDSILKTRPDIYSQLERAASAPPDPASVFDRSRGYVDEKYSALEEQFKQMKAELDKDKTQKELDATFAKFKQKYEDFDEGPIMERLEYLSNGETEPLIDLLYWATKGQMTPAKEAEIEGRLTENLQKKRSAGLVSTKGTGIKPPSKSFKTTDEAKRAAFEDAGLIL